MSSHLTRTLLRGLMLMAVLVVLKVTASIIAGYRNYFPPNFESDFLHEREQYFFGPYAGAFYLHILSGPVSLVSGLVLLSERFRRWVPDWHRRLGRIHVTTVLLGVAPSGLCMSVYAAAGPVSTLGFAALAVTTGVTAALGWRSAVRRRFAEHRRWMWRCFLLLASAVVLRVSVGLMFVLNWDFPGFDPCMSWACWLIPLTIGEWVFQTSQSTRQPTNLLASRAVN